MVNETKVEETKKPKEKIWEPTRQKVKITLLRLRGEAIVSEEHEGVLAEVKPSGRLKLTCKSLGTLGEKGITIKQSDIVYDKNGEQRITLIENPDGSIGVARYSEKAKKIAFDEALFTEDAVESIKFADELAEPSEQKSIWDILVKALPIIGSIMMFVLIFWFGGDILKQMNEHQKAIAESEERIAKIYSDMQRSNERVAETLLEVTKKLYEIKQGMSASH